MEKNSKAGLEALLTPENTTQEFQFLLFDLEILLYLASMYAFFWECKQAPLLRGCSNGILSPDQPEIVRARGRELHC